MRARHGATSSPDPSILRPEDLGLSLVRLGTARGLVEGWARSGEVAASSFTVGCRRGMIATTSAPDGDGPGSRFLAASLTKPVTAVATMILVERGLLTLDDPVAEHLPEFSANGKDAVTVRHLLTHTSGLPDQVPENEALRARHAPLSAFVEATCRQPLLFPPGTDVRYQSMGFAILGELVHRLSGHPLPVFLDANVFGPLRMGDSSLGLDPERPDAVTPVQIDPIAASTDWHWNSAYWLGLGAPWGGLLTTPGDYGRFLRAMLDEGQPTGVRILSPSGIEAMRRPQLQGFAGVAEDERRLRPWGLGWRLAWPGTSAYFGDLLGPQSFGHWGATGTVAWFDPDRDAFAVILTSRPPDARGAYLSRLSNVLASAFL